MIDTLKLHLTYPNSITINQSKIIGLHSTTKHNYETGQDAVYPLALFDNGKYLSASSAYLNTDTFQLDMTNRGTFLKFSLPKVYHGGKHNIYPIGKGGAKIVFDAVEKSLVDSGIEIPYPLASDKWDVSRADIFSNAQLAYPFYAYSAIFAMLQGKRMKQRLYGGTGFSFGNTQRTVNCYDKIAEHNIVHKGGLPEELEGVNLARVEYQGMNKQVVKRTLPYSNGKQVLEKWDNSRETYSHILSDLVFRYKDVDELFKMTQMEELEKLKKLRDTGNRFWMQAYLNLVGVASMLHLFGGWDGVRGALAELIPDRSNRNAKFKWLESKYFEASSLFDDIEPVPVAELYSELKNKLLSNVA